VCGPPDVPVEGYYSTDRDLTEYFRLMRALQKSLRHERARGETARVPTTLGCHQLANLWST
jgi:hypothetical protein